MKAQRENPGWGMVIVKLLKVGSWCHIAVTTKPILTFGIIKMGKRYKDGIRYGYLKKWTQEKLSKLKRTNNTILWLYWDLKNVELYRVK